MSGRCDGFTDLCSLQQQFDNKSKNDFVIVEVSIQDHGSCFINAPKTSTTVYQLAMLSDQTQFDTHCPQKKCKRQFKNYLDIYQHYAKSSTAAKGKVEKRSFIKCLFDWNSQVKRFVPILIAQTSTVREITSEVCKVLESHNLWYKTGSIT